MARIQVSIYLPGNHAQVTGSSRLACLIKKCPSCGHDLVQVSDKSGDTSGDNSADSAVIPGSPIGRSQEEDSQSGGWHCGFCGLHMKPSASEGDSYGSFYEIGNINNSNSPSQEDSLKAHARATTLAREVQNLTKTVKDQLGKRREHLKQCQDHISRIDHSQLALTEHVRKLGQLDLQLLEATKGASVSGSYLPGLSISRTDSWTQTFSDRPWHSYKSPSRDHSPGRLASNTGGFSSQNYGIPTFDSSANIKTPKGKSTDRTDGSVIRTTPNDIIHQEMLDRQGKNKPSIANARSYEILDSSTSSFFLSPHSEKIKSRGQQPEPMISNSHTPPKKPERLNTAPLQQTPSKPYQREQVPHIDRARPTPNPDVSDDEWRPPVPPRTPMHSLSQSHMQSHLTSHNEPNLHHLRSHSEERHLDPQRKPLHGRSQSEERWLDGENISSQAKPLRRERLFNDPRHLKPREAWSTPKDVKSNSGVGSSHMQDPRHLVSKQDPSPNHNDVSPYTNNPLINSSDKTSRNNFPKPRDFISEHRNMQPPNKNLNPDLSSLLEQTRDALLEPRNNQSGTLDDVSSPSTLNRSFEILSDRNHRYRMSERRYNPKVKDGLQGNSVLERAKLYDTLTKELNSTSKSASGMVNRRKPVLNDESNDDKCKDQRTKFQDTKVHLGVERPRSNNQGQPRVPTDNPRSRPENVGHVTRDTYMVRWGSGSEELFITTPARIKEEHRASRSIERTPYNGYPERPTHFNGKGHENYSSDKERSHKFEGQRSRSQSPGQGLSPNENIHRYMPEKSRAHPNTEAAPVKPSRSNHGQPHYGGHDNEQTQKSSNRSAGNPQRHYENNFDHRLHGKLLNGPVVVEPKSEQALPRNKYKASTADNMPMENGFQVPSLHHHDNVNAGPSNNLTSVPSQRSRLWEKPRIRSPLVLTHDEDI